MSSDDIKNGDSSDEDIELEPVEDGHRRRVVVADMETNSFKCEIALTKTPIDKGANDRADVLIGHFPCSPGFFGGASMLSLRKSGGKVIAGPVSPPPTDNEFGCKSPDGEHVFDQGNYCRSNNAHTPTESNVMQIVRRGDCNFVRKAANHHHAKGIIVINSNPYELFVMAGEKPQPGSDCSGDDLPVTVLVSGLDGELILQLRRDEESKGNVVDATITLTKESDDSIEAPHVKGSNEALQILASHGWGIHAVPQAQVEQNSGWQLFIIQHDQKV